MADESLFDAEDQTLGQAHALLEGAGDETAFREPFEVLLDRYRKLLRQAKRLVKISDRMQSELNALNRRIKESEEKYHNIFENMSEGIFRAGPEGELWEVNPALAAIFGCDSPEDLLTLAVDPLRQPRLLEREDVQRLRALVEREGAVENQEMPFRQKNGEEVWTSVSARAVYDEEGRLKLVEGLVVDITQRRRMEERLRLLATTDGLTGLPNRRHFLELGRRELERARRYGLPLTALMLDVDHFKRVNDTYGHEVGDQVLVELAGLVRRALRAHDLVGRLGGEEFGVLLPETGVQEGLAVAERLRESLAARTVETRGGRLSVTASLGLGAYRPETSDLEALLREADQALYAAKEAGRNCVRVVL
ncbi:MAG: sensor domain-containing diguanylate cyclase [Deltaproteobacteria bacterium]|nr:sensor domain-containing diguanylate cyclase [Deltaproteobacteria bacterium]